MEWVNLFRDIGIFGIAAFIIRHIIEHSSTKNLEKYKQELDFATRHYQSTLDTGIEKYKAEISLHINKQSSLHEKRLTIIDEMYKKLVTLDSAMRQMTASMKPIYDNAEKEEEERVDNAQKAFADFNNYFLYNRLYFSESICDLLEKIRKDYFSANWDYFEPKRLQSFTGGRPSPEGYKEIIKIAAEVSKKVSEEIPKTLKSLEDEFRKLLGVQ